MNPKQFLVVGGIVLTLVGILGMVGVIGPTADKSLFGDAWWFDSAENWTHLILGIVALIASFVLPAAGQKPLVMIVGIVALLFGVYSIFDQSFMAANLENPADTILHLAVGVWGVLAARGKKIDMMSPQMPA